MKMNLIEGKKEEGFNFDFEGKKKMEISIEFVNRCTGKNAKLKLQNFKKEKREKNRDQLIINFLGSRICL